MKPFCCTDFTEDKPREECGVFGIFTKGEDQTLAAESCYHGLFALQHRGQESCGIAVSNHGIITGHRGLGRVSDVFHTSLLKKLEGNIAISHVNDSKGAVQINNAQPLIIRYKKGRIAVAQNGNLTNIQQLSDDLAKTGALFQTNTNSEIIAHLIAKERLHSGNIETAVANIVPKLEGAYSLLVMSPNKLVAARDPHGFRPLVLGKLGHSDIIASESCALTAIGASFVRDILPGEVVVVTKDGVKTIVEGNAAKRRICIFEYIYYARPDSVVDGFSIHESRLRAGKRLAQQHPVDADMVIAVPDSGIDAAIGYARESGIPYGLGFVRNNYVGRTFIKPQQNRRRSSVDIKLNVLRESIQGKRIIMVDDSIVRGTTSANIIRMLKNAGAKEVHVRISSPTIHYPCFYGTDIPAKDKLVANRRSLSELRLDLGADSLGFLYVDSLNALIDANTKTYCDACFTGDYPIQVQETQTSSPNE